MSRLVKCVTKMVTGCLRPTKVAIFVVGYKPCCVQSKTTELTVHTSCYWGLRITLCKKIALCLFISMMNYIEPYFIHLDPTKELQPHGERV